MKYWLIKSEPSSYSIDDLKRDERTAWTGVRNFQARNHMRDMKKGDLLLFYHSGGTPREPAGVYGVAKVVKTAYMDPTALDSKDEHYDAKAVKYVKEGKEPLWICVDVAFVKKLLRPVTLAEIKNDKELRSMLVARRGQRLSVMPVEEKHFERIVE
jgi:predicted RNA-binding protein with PUA-like domain